MESRSDRRPGHPRQPELAVLGLVMLACASNHAGDGTRGGSDSGGVSGATEGGSGPNSVAGAGAGATGVSPIGGSAMGIGSMAGVAGEGGAQAVSGSSGGDSGTGTCDVLGCANADCKRVCMAGCYVNPQLPADCSNSCFSIFTEGWFSCPSETTTYVKCVGDMRPLYFCPGYAASSPCSNEASTMIQCIKDHR